jgi:glycosyltransferase involved in cell wall biosynthesis
MAGHEVTLICALDKGEPRFERQGQLVVRRLPIQDEQAKGAFRYLFEVGAFFLMATVLAGALHLRRRFDVVQVNSIPDTLVFSALLPRLLGARVLLDLSECMPEFFATKFKTGLNHPGVRLMAWLEQASIGFADFAITCTDQMREAFVARGAPRSKIEVVLNSADEELFDPERFPPRPRESGNFVLICHGTVVEHYGQDTTVQAVALLKDEMPELRLEIYGGPGGRGSYVETLQSMAKDLGVEDRVSFSGGWAPMEDLLGAIAAADAGIVAMKRDPFRDLTQCNKMYDFISMRKPALISRTRSVEECFPEECFQYFESGDAADLARAIRELYADPALGERLVERAASVNEPYRWPVQRKRYLDAIERLLPATRRREPDRRATSSASERAHPDTKEPATGVPPIARRSPGGQAEPNAQVARAWPGE